MHKFIKLIFIFSLLFNNSTVSAQNKINTQHVQESNKQLIHELNLLKQVTNKISSFTMDFSQETYSALRNKTTTSKGLLEFKKPNFFRWEILSPQKEMFINNGIDFWKFNATLKHAQRLPPTASDIEFLNIFLKIDSFTKSYIIEPWKFNTASEPLPDVLSENPPTEVKNKIYIKLTPKSNNKQKIIYLVVNKTQGYIDEIRITFENNNRSRVVFSNFTVKDLNDTRFNFTPPPGTAVDKL